MTTTEAADEADKERRAGRRRQAQQLREQLAELPDLCALLPLLFEPRSASGAGGGGGHATSRPPVNLDVLDLASRREKPWPRRGADQDRLEWWWRDRAGKVIVEPAGRRQGVLPTLVSWCSLVATELEDAGERIPEYGRESCGANCEEAPVRARSDRREGPCSAVARRHWAPPTVAGEVGFLLEHAGWSSEQRWFGELVDDVQTIWRDLRSALRERSPVRLRCTDPKCRWDVEAMDGGSWFRCTGCPRTWSHVEVARLYQRQQPMHLGECAELLDRPVKTLYDWRRKGWLRPVGRDNRGSLYDYADVVNVAANVANGVQFAPATR